MINIPKTNQVRLQVSRLYCKSQDATAVAMEFISSDADCTVSEAKLSFLVLQYYPGYNNNATINMPQVFRMYTFNSKAFLIIYA